MSNGKIKDDGQGGFVGVLETLEHSLKIVMKRVNGTTPESPQYEILAFGKGGGLVKVGAAWEKTAEKTGEIFYSMTLDDPSFGEKLNVTAFKHPTEYGVYDIVWRRPRGDLKAAA